MTTSKIVWRLISRQTSVLHMKIAYQHTKLSLKALKSITNKKQKKPDLLLLLATEKFHLH